MRICDVTQFYSPVSGGVKRYIHEKIRHLRERSDDEHLLIIPGDRDERRQEERCVVYTVHSPLVSRQSRYRAFVRLSALDEILEAERPDLIECGDPYQLGWRTAKTAARLKIPAIAFYHSHFAEACLRSARRWLGGGAADRTLRLSQRYVRSLYNRFEQTLVPSPALAELLVQWGLERVAAVDLGFNASIFRPEPDDADQTRCGLGIPLRGERQLLLYVGRLAGEKNTQTLFAAYELLARENPGRFHLLIVGDGLQRRQVQRLQKAQLGVTWLPYCDDSRQLAAIYRSADLFIHPGVQETFGLVTLESQASGTPVVGIRGSFMDRIIFGGQAHWSREDSPRALADAIRLTVISDLDAMGQAASRAVHARYAWERVFEAVFGIYRETVAAYKSRHG